MSGVRKIAMDAVQLGGVSRPLDRPLVVAAAAVEPSVGSEAIYKQAYVEGFAAGEEDGRTDAQRQASETLGRLEQALAEAEAAKQRWSNGLHEAIEQFEQVTLRQNHAMEHLAAEVAEIAVRRIVGRLQADRLAVEAACRETLRALHIESAQVRVSPLDRDAFVEQLPPGVELVADASLEPGACLLRSPLGDIDASLATQLAQLREALVAVLAEDRA